MKINKLSYISDKIHFMRTFLLTLLMVFPLVVFAQNNTGVCTGKAYGQFDFWVGNWEVHNPEGELVGRNTILKEEGGCVITESYSSTTTSFTGRSLNFYNPDSGKWEQLWVDNQGSYLHLSGGLINTSMVLKGVHGKGEKKQTDKITWTLLDDGRVRQLWERQSADEHWATIFEGYYTAIDPG